GATKNSTSMQRGPDCLSGSNATQNVPASTRSPIPGSDKPAYAATIFNHHGARPAQLGCLGVRGFVRLSVIEPLAFGPTQQRFGALCIVKTECGAMVVFEIRFCKVAMQMRFADMVELPVHGAFQ